MPRVIVIGGANVDIKGRASGPFLAGTSNPGRVTLASGGVGRNIAENLAYLGCAVSLVTVLGADSHGQFLRQACGGAGIDLSHAITVDEPTGTYLAVLNKDGEMVSAVSDMRAIDRLSPAHLDAASEMLARADMLVADCNIPADCLVWVCGFAAKHGLRLLIEPVSVPKAMKLLGFTRAEPVFAVTPNAQQLQALTGGNLARLHALGFANIVVHRGGEGALASDGRGVTPVSAQVVSAIADVTGAGDAAVAGLIAGILEGLPLAKAAQLGQCAAVLKLGSAQSVAAGLNRDSLLAAAGL
jgi:pseudouridine kinase